MNKREAQKLHARRRLKERYGTDLTSKQIGELLHQIQTGQSAYVERASLRVSKHLVSLDGTEYLVVYDKRRKTICTFLSPEHAEYQRILKEREIHHEP